MTAVIKQNTIFIAQQKNLKKRKESITKAGAIAFCRDSQPSTVSRRNFLLNSALLSLGASLPLYSCVFNSDPKLIATRDPKLLSKTQWDNLIAVQEVLFPHEEEAPGAVDVNAAGFFQWVLADPLLDPAEIKFKINGLDKLENESLELYNSTFSSLSAEDQDKTLKNISTKSWGRSWISVMLLHIFEALLSDPIYGSNIDEKGWKWLDYSPGIPRPVKGRSYLDYTLSDGSNISNKNA